MRPNRLTMRAFGPYVEETVEFDQLGNGLYLITGNTGAGKTSIFDAIVYALYGVASGSGRTVEMFHSDYVGKHEKTWVELVFTCGKKRYKVTRTFHLPKKRDGSVDKPSKSAVLEEEGKAPVKNETAVTARITELLGLDASQFRQIIMLAQGEFRRFLESGSDERGKILGRLFDNRLYLDFQLRLRKAADCLDSQRKETERKIALLVSTLYLPEGLEEEERAKFHPDHPQLEEALTRLVREDRQTLETLDGALQQEEQRREALRSRRTLGQQRNQRLEELERKRREQRTLEAQRERMEDLALRYDRAGRALRQVRPSAAALEQAGGRLAQTEKELADWQKQKETEQTRRKALEEENQRWQEQVPQMEQLSHQIRAIEETIPDYDRLEDSRRQLRQAEQARKSAEQAESEAKKQKTQLEAQQSQLQARLEELREADVACARLDGELEQAERRQTRLADLQTRLSQLNQLGEEGKRLKQDYQQQLLRMQAAGREYERVYLAFLAGQAGLLAADLEAALAENGEAACPVCGTRFCGTEHPGFARKNENTPTQNQVEQARSAMEQERTKGEKQALALKEKRAAWQEGKKLALSLGAELLPGCGDWQTLSQPGYLEGEISAGQKNSQTLKNQLEQAQKDQKAKNETAQALQSLASQLEQTEKALSQSTEALQRAREVSTRLAVQVEEGARKLPFSTREEALREQSKLTARRNELQKGLDQTREKLEACQQELVRLDGLLDSGGARRDSQRKEVETAEKQLDEARQEAGFASIEDYCSALAPEGQMVDEAWLKAQEQLLTHYRNQCRDCASQLQTLELETADWEWVDLTQLDSQLAELEARLARQKKERDAFYHRRESNQQVASGVAEAKEELRRTGPASRKLSRLAQVANGLDNALGKYSFDRYVLSAFFEEIIAQANRHLDLMSGGKYSLARRETADRKSGAAGLDLEVCDAFTGERRKTPSLSGGESFQVSLALALGLSDVVQQHAGGIQMDTMFIDEGFGSLDDQALEKALEVLRQLAGDSRQVGIISHVEKLEECIPQKILVKGGRQGSSIEIQT